MNQQRHIIKKQVLELQLSSQQGTFELQNEVSRIYRNKIIPLIDTYLSQFSTSDKTHRIDRLEINLGNIDLNNLEEELIVKFEEEIRQQVAQIISTQSSEDQGKRNVEPQNRDFHPNWPENSSSRNPTISFPWKSTQSNQVEANRERSLLLTSTESQSNQTAFQLELFSYFIQTGNLPWWSPRLSKQDLEKLCARLLETSPEQIKLILAQSFKEEKYSRRIIYQFSDSTILKFTQLNDYISAQSLEDQGKTNVEAENKDFHPNWPENSSSRNPTISFPWKSTQSNQVEANRERSRSASAKPRPTSLSSTDSQSNQTASQIELFSYFIQTGNLPW